MDDLTGADTPGSSPQARGTPAIRYRGGNLGRFIPAGAGNADRKSAATRETSVHPRRRGERMAGPHSGQSRGGSSPQARGTPWRDQIRLLARRFIPAGAGNACAA